MVPAPATSQHPTSLLTARQEVTIDVSATFLEMLLITLALIISIFVTFTPKQKVTRKQPRNPAFSAFVILIALFLTVAAFSLALLTLVLGWLRVISLDAVAAIVFALGPAFIAIPIEILIYWRNSLTTHMMWSNPSLNIPTAQVRYIRFLGGDEIQNEQPCLKLLRPDQPDTNLKPIKWADSSIMIMRFMPQYSSSSFACRFLSRLRCIRWSQLSEDPTALAPLPPFSEHLRRPEPRDPQWNHVYGRHITTYSNFSTIQDIDDGVTSWWWSGVCSARHLVARPKILHLRSKRRVVNALALLSDIITIGDLVLHFHRNIFHWMLRKDQEMRTAVTSAPGFTCNRILRELEMDGWDSVGTEVLSSDFEFPIESRKRYSILFLILGEKSQRFAIPRKLEGSGSGEVYSGQAVLETLWEERDKKKFFQTAEQCVNKWLKGWGLRIDEVKQLAEQCPLNCNA